MNPFDLIKNMKNLEGQMTQVKNELSNLTATGSAGGNMVQITLNGEFRLLSIKIDPIAVDPRDVKMLEDIIVAAHCDAISKIQEKIKEKSGSLMGNMDFSKLGL